MRRIVLDTNFIFALFVITDPCHIQALEVYAKFEGEITFIVPQIVLAELLVSAEERDFIKLAERINCKISSTAESDLLYISELQANLKRQLKAIDCLILACCTRHNAELLTFDKQLMKAYKINIQS